MAAKPDKVQLSHTQGLPYHRVLVTQSLQTVLYRIWYQKYYIQGPHMSLSLGPVQFWQKEACCWYLKASLTQS